MNPTRSCLRRRWAALVAALFLVQALTGQESLAAPASDENPLKLSTQIDLSFEYRYRSANELIETATVKSGIDLYRNIISAPPMALFNWELGRREGLGLGFGAEVRREFDDASDGAFFPTTNFLPLGRAGNPIATENPMITRGVLFWRSEDLSITLGRDKVDFGEGIKGSLYPSTRLPYLDALKAKARFGPLGMDYMVATIRAAPSWDGHTVDPNHGVDTSDFPAGEDPYGFMDDPNPTIVLEAMHRFTWDFPRFRLGVAGHVMYARRNNYFLITDFLPVIAWHQTKIYPNNLTFYLDARWEPVEGLVVTGMGGMDEINSDIFGVYDSGSPTVPGGVLAVDWKGPAGDGEFRLYGEAGYTHYLWGNFDGSLQVPHDEDTLARAQYYYHMDEGAGLIPLTSPYGPGATWGRLEGSWLAPGGTLRCGLELLFLSKIKDANLITTEVLNPSDPAAAADAPRLTFFEAALALSYRIAGFEAYLRPAVLVRDGTWWVEATVGGRYTFQRSTALDKKAR